MSGRTRARVLRVRVDKHSAILAAAADVDDQVLYVKDAGDLADDDNANGTVLVDDNDGTRLAYTSIDRVEDTDQGDLTSPDVVHLAEPLTVALDAGAQLWAWEEPDDPDDDGIVADYIAECVPEDDEDAAELGSRLDADIPPEHREDLPIGQQPDPGVPVVLEYDDETDDWTVVRLRGASRGLRYNRHHLTGGAAPDGGTAGDAVSSDEITAGVLTRQLPHRRIARSQAFRAMVNGVEYGPGAWELDPVSGVVTLTLGGWETTDNADIWFEYWHRGLTVIAPDPDPPVPVAPTWRLICKIADYEDTSGTYHYPSGPLTGNTSMPFDGFNGDYQLTVDYSELGGATFADLGIVGWKIVARCTGDPGSSGHVGFVINLDNPHYPGAPQWPDGGASGGGITIDSYWGDGVQGSIPVTAGVTEVFEHELAVNSTSSDPYYEGFNYNDMLGKLEVSLKSTYGGFPHLVVEVEGNGLVGACTVEQFDIVLIGTP